MAVNLNTISRSLPLLTHEHINQGLWASDTGRNSNSGTYSGTFIGYFSQLKLSFGKTTQAQMNNIKSLFEQPIIEVTYKDSNTGSWRTEQFYGNSINAKLDYWDGLYEGFEITLTALRKR